MSSMVDFSFAIVVEGLAVMVKSRCRRLADNNGKLFYQRNVKAIPMITLGQGIYRYPGHNFLADVQSAPLALSRIYQSVPMSTQPQMSSGVNSSANLMIEVCGMDLGRVGKVR